MNDPLTDAELDRAEELSASEDVWLIAGQQLGRVYLDQILAAFALFPRLVAELRKTLAEADRLREALRRHLTDGHGDPDCEGCQAAWAALGEEPPARTTDDLSALPLPELAARAGLGLVRSARPRDPGWDWACPDGPDPATTTPGDGRWHAWTPEAEGSQRLGEYIDEAGAESAVRDWLAARARERETR